jgi:hypothetical protein
MEIYILLNKDLKQIIDKMLHQLTFVHCLNQIKTKAFRMYRNKYMYMWDAHRYINKYSRKTMEYYRIYYCDFRDNVFLKPPYYQKPASLSS